MDITKEEVEPKIAGDKPVVEEPVKEEEKVSKDEVKPVEEAKSTEESKTIEESKTDKPAEEMKVDSTPEDVTPELLEKIKKQVEYYFGDSNMHKDKFLIEQTHLDEGWVPMSVMLKFKMLESLSKNADTILKSIESSDLMDISDDKKKIRRKLSRPLPIFDQEYKKAEIARTVYVKGFPVENVFIQQLKEFFNDFEPFENIVMRRYLDKEKKMKFKGSVFVQFVTLDDAKKFMARESVKYGETELIRKFSADYSVEKAKEKAERQEKNEFKGKKSSEKENGDAETEEATDSLKLPKGAVLHFTGASKACDWDDIKKSLMQLDADIAYVDYKLGDSSGHIRLHGENSAKPIIEKMKDNKVTIKDNELTFKILEDQEEDDYLKSVQSTMASKKQKSFKGKRGRPKKGRGGGGGGHRGRKRNASPHRESGAAKKVAV